MYVRGLQRAVYIICACVLVMAPLSQTGRAFADADKKAAPVQPKSPDDLDLIDVGTVSEIKQSDIFVLNNGKTYRMDQIRVPVPYNNAALNYLSTGLLGQKVGIYALKNPKIPPPADRYGNLYGHVMRDDGTWIQADMVARGLAWAFSAEPNRALVVPLYQYEAAARADKLGFWKDPEYVIKTKANIAKYVNSYQIYQGVIVGHNWTGDKYVFACDFTGRATSAFTFSIKTDKALNFVPPGTRPEEVFGMWRNVMVRVHGWVERDPTSPNNVPVMDVTHPEQIEFLNPDTGEPVLAR